MIGTVIKGNLKICFNKILARTENEGLGMIDIKPYIEGLRLGLLKRHINNNDFWVIEIKQKHISSRYKSKQIKNGKLNQNVHMFLTFIFKYYFL